jgi:hypothetical protein
LADSIRRLSERETQQIDQTRQTLQKAGAIGHLPVQLEGMDYSSWEILGDLWNLPQSRLEPAAHVK